MLGRVISVLAPSLASHIHSRLVSRHLQGLGAIQSTFLSGRSCMGQAEEGGSPAAAAAAASEAIVAAGAEAEEDIPTPKRAQSSRAAKAAATKAAKAAAAEAVGEVPAATSKKRINKTKAAAADDGEEPAAAKPKRARSAKPVAVDGEEQAAAKPKRARAAKPAAVDGEEPAAAAAAPKKRASKPKKDEWPPGPLYSVSMRPARYEGPAHRIMSWNVAGIRALLKKNAEALKQVVAAENVDVLCIQEHKLQDKHVEDIIKAAGLEGWEVFFNSSTTLKGYSGTAIFCKEKPLSSRLGIGHVDHDDEGRVVTVELPELWVVNVYVPNSGDGLKRLDYRTQQWDKALVEYMKGLQASKPVVVAGDMNCAHKPIDLANPKTNLRSAGFTQEERDSFSAGLLGEVGLVDTWRAQHPGVVGYTYYGYRFNMRAKGKGWRLDYMLVSPGLAERVHDSYILPDVEGSDHLPLGIVIRKQQQQ